MSGAAGRWARRAVAALAVLTAAQIVYETFDEATRVWKRSHRRRHESLSEAQDRLFGSGWMERIREIRARVGARETVYLVDAQSREQGATYFVLHYLAPRPVVMIGNVRKTSLRRIGRRVPARDAWIVVVGDPGSLPVLMRGSELSRRSRRGR